MSTPFPNDPINNIEWVDATSLFANTWNPNRVAKAELRLLELSLLKTGWIQPILATRDGMIIDGFHRWRLTQDSKTVKRQYDGLIPVTFLDLSRPEGMMLTIRINRAKGTHSSVHMSRIIHELIGEHAYEREEIARAIGATKKEVDLLAQDGVFAAREIKNHAYSPAWYPKEVSKEEAARIRDELTK